jgi:hypothetical protein
MKIQVTTVVTAVVLSITGCAANQANVERLAVQSGEDIVRLIQQSQHQRVAERFHTPSAYSAAERHREVTGIAKALAIFEEEFGRVAAFQPGNVSREGQDASVESATPQYWFDTNRRTYDYYGVAKPENGAEFRLTVKFSSVDGRLWLRAIAYGEPVDFSAKVTRSMQRVIDEIIRPGLESSSAPDKRT